MGSQGMQRCMGMQTQFVLATESSGRLGTRAGPGSLGGPAGYLRALYSVDNVLGWPATEGPKLSRFVPATGATAQDSARRSGGQRGMTEQDRVIVLGDMFELNARLERLKELWPNRADHLDEVEAILHSLLLELEEDCRRLEIPAGADECRRRLQRSELFRRLKFSLT